MESKISDGIRVKHKRLGYVEVINGTTRMEYSWGMVLGFLSHCITICYMKVF